MQQLELFEIYQENNKEIPCPQCQTLFKKKSDSHKFCSKTCYKKNFNRKYWLNNKEAFKLRRYIRVLLFDIKKPRTKKMENLLGITSLKELKEHFEKQFKEGMTWENHGNNGWHVDHIIPCYKFNLKDKEEQKKFFHYSNLRPLWHYENRSKGYKTP